MVIDRFISHTSFLNKQKNVWIKDAFRVVNNISTSYYNIYLF